MGTEHGGNGQANGSHGAAHKGGGNGSDAGVNVQVLLRCRPLADHEKNQRVAVKCNAAGKEVTVMQHIGNKQMGRTFTFDRVFGPPATQEDVYQYAVAPIVKEVLDGFNCTIFAYGQTGTGKTFTMEGDISRDGSAPGPCLDNLAQGAGVIPRAITHIFQTLEEAGSEYSVKVSQSQENSNNTKRHLHHLPWGIFS